MNIEEKYTKLINNFKNISKIPRNSKKEEKIADYICELARENNLWYKKDEFNNVLVKREASKGYENKKKIIFQAHLDMVCEKATSSSHNFDTDPIEIVEKDGKMMANGTTLGADDGIGVSFLLLLMLEKEPHRAMYFLFTTQEEIGMNGAKFVDLSEFNDASYMINLDSEEENSAIIGCAGGVTTTYFKRASKLSNENELYKITISNLFGGHSGVDINKGRMNANYLMARILNELNDVKISYFHGGNKDNAIPNACDAIFETSNKEEIRSAVNSAMSKIKFVKEDKNVNIDIEKVDKECKVISKEDSKNFISMLLNLKQGVIKEDKFVEASGNIGIVNVEDGEIKIVESLRASDDTLKQEIEDSNDDKAIKNLYDIEKSGLYPGWKPKHSSKLQQVYKESYKKVHKKTPKIESIHAGLECGLFYSELPHLDIISIGPDIKNVHTVNETLYLNSCKNLLETLCFMLDLLD